MYSAITTTVTPLTVTPFNLDTTPEQEQKQITIQKQVDAENGLPDDLPNLYGPVTYDMIGKPVDAAGDAGTVSSDQQRGQTD